MEDLKNKILEEYKKGNIVVAGFEGIQAMLLKDFINQPADGMLYDLNRLESVVLTFLPDPKWINDYAVSQVIRELKNIIDEKKAEIIKQKPKEFILCASLNYNGTIISAARHSDCYDIIQELFPNPVLPDREHQGFLTSLNRYVDRKEGWKIAKENNQIQFGLTASENDDDSILISENLY